VKIFVAVYEEKGSQFLVYLITVFSILSKTAG